MRIQLAVVATVASLLSCTAYAQTSQGGLAPSLDRAWSAPLTEPPSVRLGGVDVATLMAEDAVANVNKDVKYRFGAELPVQVDAAVDGVWDQLDDGSWLWRVQIHSTDARSLNLIFDRFVIPPGARLFLHNPDTGEQLGAFTDYNMQASETLATMVMAGETVIVEYHEPANAAFAGDLRIGTVVHGYREFWDRFAEKGFGDSGNCNNNVVCPVSLGWEDPIRSVLILVDGGGFCTGVLVNNTANDGTPYVLTADHCGGGESNWVFVFNWESSTCPNPGTNLPQSDSVSGGVVRASRSASDFRLVETNNPIPTTYNPFYAGWDYSGNTAAWTVGIHHPSGDLKKFSQDDDPPVLGGYYGAGNDHWEVVDWDDGTTEPGSSGSPLFDDQQRIIGQLHGGTAACGNNAEDYYGAFHISWDAGSSSASRLMEWLDPLGIDPGVQDGWDPNAPTAALDAAIVQIAEPVAGSQSCVDPTPVLRLRNRGTDTLTEVEIEVQVDGGGWVLDQLWTGSLSSASSVDVSLTPLMLGVGAHTLEVRLVAPNGSVDEDPSNDEASVDFEQIDGTGVLPPVFDDFEASSFPGTGWTLFNPDSGVTWARTLDAGGFDASGASARVNNFDTDFAGQQDWLQTPIVDLSAATSATLDFDYAYARYSSAYADRMQVLASADCGGTWDVLFDAASDGLSTTGANEQNFFIPTAAEWLTESYDLGPYIGGSVTIAFVNESGYGNNLYLDNVNLDAVGQGDNDDDGDCACDSSPCTSSSNPSCAVLVSGDCDDSDPTRSPLNPEVTCDGIDNDCDAASLDAPDADGDGVTVCTDCNDNNPLVFPGNTEVPCDGLNNDCTASPDNPDADGDGFGACTGDCDDADSAVNPGATELSCDGLDNDCDPATADAPDLDADGDDACIDCDDSNPLVGPSLAEVACDSLDNDCDPATVDAPDVDVDGFTVCANDCDDGNGAVNPAAVELTCDGVDNDCDPATIDTPDLDGDGDDACIDCDDADPLRGPGQVEIQCDNIDNDCDGATSDAPDVDGDGFSTCTGDCDDADPARSPGMAELSCDGVDNDCDPATPDGVDADGDGDDQCTDCDDADPARSSLATELTCDGIDNDCDPATVDAVDDDGDGYSVCVDDCDDSDPAIHPGAAELTCDGIDNDCSAATSDAPDTDGDGDSVCTDCDDTDPTRSSTAIELTCDGIDNDCDALTLDAPDGDGDGDSVCTDCDDADPTRAAGLAELECDGIDNDCDLATLDGPDADGDGDSVCTDCDDTDPLRSTTQLELTCDGIDNDCDALTLDAPDLDGDGDPTCTDCDDADPSRATGLPELECDGIDNDCDLATLDGPDLDLDGDPSCTDCDDADPTRASTLPEVCDAIDNDCDGTIPTDELDEDLDGLATCEGDCDDADAFASPELPEDTEPDCTDGFDNDCDGLIDPDDPDCAAFYAGTGTGTGTGTATGTATATGGTGTGTGDGGTIDYDTTIKGDGSGCGCSGAADAPGAPLTALMLLAGLVARRRDSAPSA